MSRPILTAGPPSRTVGPVAPPRTGPFDPPEGETALETTATVEVGPSVPRWLVGVVVAAIGAGLIALAGGGAAPTPAPRPPPPTAPPDDGGSGPAPVVGVVPTRITDSVGAWAEVDVPADTHQLAAVDGGLLAVTAPPAAAPALWLAVGDDTGWSPLADPPPGTDRLDIVDGVAVARGSDGALSVLIAPTDPVWHPLGPATTGPAAPSRVSSADRGPDGTTVLAVHAGSTTSLWSVPPSGRPTRSSPPAPVSTSSIARVVARSGGLVDVLTADRGWFTIGLGPEPSIVDEAQTIVGIGSVGGNQLGLEVRGRGGPIPHVRSGGSAWTSLMVPPTLAVGPFGAVARSQPSDLGRTPIALEAGSVTVSVVPETGRPTIERAGRPIPATLERAGPDRWLVVLDDEVLGAFTDADWLVAADRAGYDPTAGRLGLSQQFIHVTGEGTTWLRSPVNQIAGRPIHVDGASVSPSRIVIEADDAAIELEAIVDPIRRWYQLRLPGRSPSPMFPAP